MSMSRLALPPTAAVELARVSADDARYILCVDDRIVVGGSRAGIAEALAFTPDLGSRLTDRLFAVADKMGGNSRRTAWGVGRHVPHRVKVRGGSTVDVGIIADDFVRLVDDIESSESAARRHGGADEPFSRNAVYTTTFAVQTILAEDAELFGKLYDTATFNATGAHFIRSGLQRLGAHGVDVDISELSAKAPVGVVSWDFQAVLADVGFTALVKRYSDGSSQGGVVAVPGISFYLDASRPREFMWWIAASSFLLADVEGEEFASIADATAAGVAVVGEFVQFDPWDIVRVFTGVISSKDGAEDVRGLLRRCAASGYPIDGLPRLLRRGVSVAELNTLIDAGLDWDISSAVLD